MSPAHVSDSAIKKKSKVGVGAILRVSGGGVKYLNFILKSSSLFIIPKPQIGWIWVSPSIQSVPQNTF